MNLKSYMIGIFLALLVVNAFADSRTASKTSQLKAVGQAEMRWLMFPLYRVTLKTKDGQYRKNQYPQMLDILYLRNIDKRDLLTATNNEWKGLGIPDAQRKEWIRQLGNLWPSIKRGDRLAFQVGTGGQNYFTFNDKKIGGISDKQFGSSFLAIWLSPKTSRPRIRQRLLAGV